MAQANIRNQPQALRVHEGRIATFRVVAELPAGAVGAIAYQWQMRTAAGVWEDIVGANRDTHITPPLTQADSFRRYRVRLTNAGDTVDSAEAELIVLAAVPAPGGAGGGQPLAAGARAHVGAGVVGGDVGQAQGAARHGGMMAPDEFIRFLQAVAAQLPPHHEHTMEVIPRGVNSVHAPIQPPQMSVTTRLSNGLLAALVAAMLALVGITTWIFTSRATEPPRVKVLICASQCMEMRVAAGEKAEDAKAACERICAPTQAPSVMPPPAPMLPPAPVAADDFAACVLDLMSHGVRQTDAKCYCK